jgi:hypothetical protein
VTRPGAPTTSGLRDLARRWGWRAHAVPVLSVATVLALLDVALHGG